MLSDLIKKKKVIYPVIVILVIIAIVVSVKILKKSPAASGGQERAAIPVLTETVQMGDLSSINTLTGLISANIQTSIGTKVSGRVAEVDVDMGQKVSKGQILAKIDSIDLEKQLDQTEAQIQVDQAQVDIAQNNSAQSTDALNHDTVLYNSNAISKDTLNQAQTKMENDKDSLLAAQGTLGKDTASAAIIQQQINETDIVSPIDGAIATRNIEVGMQVSSATTLFSIAQLNPLKVTINVSDQLIASISNGAGVNITVPEIASSTFQGTVDKISPVLDASTHSYPVEIIINNPDDSLTPGMTASVQFTGLTTTPGIIIPAEAVVETPQGSEVFTVVQNVAHMHLVQLGAVSNDKILVSSGLNPGDQIIIKGQTLIADNAKVKVVDSEDQAGVQGMINQVKQGAKQ